MSTRTSDLAQVFLWPPCPKKQVLMNGAFLGSIWVAEIHKSPAEIWKNEKGDAWSTYVELRCFKILLDVYPHNRGSSLENQTSQSSDAKSHLGSQNAVTKPNAVCPLSNSESLRKWHGFCACFPCSNNSWQIARAKWIGPSAKVSAWNNCSYETGSILILSWKGRLCIYIPKD